MYAGDKTRRLKKVEGLLQMELWIAKDAPQRPLNKHWQFCVGSGHAGLALRTDYCRQLARVHKELRMERVRFHGIFCDDMHTLHNLKDFLPLPGGKRFTEQSFRLCGLAYDNVLEAGMQPFVELGFMPKHLAKRNKRGLFYYKPNISLPKSDAAWEEYIKAFIRFLLQRYGARRVEGWYFEVWNEPDLRIAFFNGSQDDYFHLYEVTVRAIKEVNPRLMVGGPSTSGSKWVDAFVSFCSSRGVPLDFVTTHQYAGDPLGGVQDQGGPSAKENTEKIGLSWAKLRHLMFGRRPGTVLEGLRQFMGDNSETGDIAGDIFMKNAPIVKRQAGGLPVFYTEWNENATFSAYTNDTRKVAAYDAKVALDIAEDVTGSSIWCFSDIFEELHPFPEEFHGGFGLLSQHGIPKPVYHAMKMLADVEGQHCLLDVPQDSEISAYAFKSEAQTQLLLVRQKMKNLDLPKLSAAVAVELDVPPAAVTLRRIDENHGNPLKVWEAQGRPMDITPAEALTISEETAVREEALKYHYEGGVLRFAVELGVNDLYFIQIMR